MSTKWNLLGATVLGAAVFAGAVGCQTYDFEPVEPLALSQYSVAKSIEAQARKPNLMLLVDWSGSMDLVGACEPGTTVCPKRWTQLQRSIAAFLAKERGNGTKARYGLTIFPKNPSANIEYQCTAPGTVTGDPAMDAEPDVAGPLPASDDPAALQAAADAIVAKLNGLASDRMAGGTPIGASIRFVGSLPELHDDSRQDIILLLTDGLPNCNPENPSDPTVATQCKCTGASATDCSQDSDRKGCLDMDATAAAIKSLRQPPDENIDLRTIVVGFGAETTGQQTDTTRPDPFTTLNAMAKEGGFERRCKSDADCSGLGNACDGATGRCKQQYYQAQSEADLTRVLNEIIIKFPEPCEFAFTSPEDLPSRDELIVVLVDGKPMAREENGQENWRLVTEGAVGVHFVGAMCERIKASTPDDPVSIDIRSVQVR